MAPCKVNYDMNTAKELLLLAPTLESQQVSSDALFLSFAWIPFPEQLANSTILAQLGSMNPTCQEGRVHHGHTIHFTYPL